MAKELPFLRMAGQEVRRTSLFEELDNDGEFSSITTPRHLVGTGEVRLFLRDLKGNALTVYNDKKMEQIRRRRPDAEQFASFPGGMTGEEINGETPDEAIVREALEECINGELADIELVAHPRDAIATRHRHLWTVRICPILETKYPERSHPIFLYFGLVETLSFEDFPCLLTRGRRDNERVAIHTENQLPGLLLSLHREFLYEPGQERLMRLMTAQ